MKNILRKLIVTISCICFALNSYGQSSGLGILIQYPTGGLGAGTSATVSVSVKNNLGATLNTVFLNYQINGMPFSYESFAPNLLPNDSTTLTFSAQFIVPVLLFDLCVLVDSVNGLAAYDTTCGIVVGISVLNPNYSENFDGVNPGWYQNSSNTNTQWELGTPNFGTTNSTHSGINSWDINLNSSYDISAYALLYSPFFDVMGTTDLRLSFWQNRNTQEDYDGFRLEVCKNSTAWDTLGSINDPLGINWYTKIINSSGLPAWDSSSGGWQQSFYNASQLANTGLIQFRFVFTSDNSINSDGVTIDDFNLYQCNLTTNLPASFSICLGNSAVLCPNVSGGTPPYIYLWNNGTTSSCTTSNITGSYSVNIYDANGCSASCSTIVIVNALPTPVITGINSICQGGSTTFDAGAGYASYQWSNGTTTQIIPISTAGTYTVTVTDGNGCTNSASLTLSVNSNPTPIITGPSSVCPGASALLDVGAGFVALQWSNGSFTQTISISSPGTYTVTVTDINGCVGSASFIVVSSTPTVMVDSVIASGCGSNDGSFYFSSNSATYTAYVNGVASGSTNNLSPGVYNLYLIDNTCSSDTIQIVVPDSCIDVYPGDANYDLVADNKDLLQIGLAFGNTGPVRPAASNTWIAQPCPDWSNWFNIGVNQKHADCDGNGLIDAYDTVPVLLNYGLTHPLKPNNILQINTTAPDLYLFVSQDTAGLSNIINVDVYCGTVLNPIDSIYGLAFSLHYDSALTDASTASYNITNTFLGTPGIDIISISKNFASGYDDFAITRTNHQNVSGNGLVCRFSILTSNTITGNSSNNVLSFSLSNVTSITANENPITLDAFGDSIFIDSTMTGINYLNWDKEVKVYPNPANNYFIVASSLTNISKITLLNSLGETIYKNEKLRMPQRINVSNIPDGVYILRIETKYVVMHRKMQVIR